MRVFIFLIISFCALNANAQLGDFFRKLGDAVDSLAVPINSDQNNKKVIDEDKNNLTVPSKALTINEVPDAFLGRWATVEVCNVITYRKAGVYISKKEIEIVIEVFAVDSSKLLNSSLVNGFEQYEKNNKVFLKGTGNFIDENNKVSKMERTWDITNITNRKLLIVDLKIGDQYLIKDGRYTNGLLGSISAEKCSIP